MSAATQCLMLTLLTVSLAITAQAASAPLDYPSRVIRVILPQPAGGGTDVVARAVAARLTEAWGQQTIVDNRPGANGIIGTEAVVRSKPDGYTLLYGFTSLVTINPAVYKSLPYDPSRDLVPVTQTVYNNMALVTHPNLPVRSVKDLVTLAKQRAGELMYGSFGIGNQTHLTAELFRLEAGLKMLHVPYKGETPAITELVGGQVALMFSPSAGVTPHVRSGRLRLLALCGEKRAAAFPDTPTMVESGLPGVVSIGWGGLFAPTGTPREIVQKLAGEVARQLGSGEVRERLASLGAEPVGSSPDEFGAVVRAETEKWARVVRGAGLYHSQ